MASADASADASATPPPPASTPPPTSTPPRGKKVSIDYLLEGESVRTNAHLRAFASSTLPDVLRTDPNYRSWASINSRSLRKEIAEASAAAARIPPAFAKARGLPLGPEDPLGDGAGVVIFDLCSGKGFAALFLAHRYPRARVHMLDSNRKMNLDHLDSLHPRVTFECLDIYDDAALKLVRDATRRADRGAVVVGVHLCGDLARRGAELWRRSGADALVLSPCCLVRELPEKKRPSGRFGYGLPALAKRSGWDAYGLWCRFLWHHVRGLGSERGGDEEGGAEGRMAHEEGGGRSVAHEGRGAFEGLGSNPSVSRSVIRANLDWDEDMISERNAFVTASACAPCPAAAEARGVG